MNFEYWEFAEIMAYIFSDQSHKQEVINLVNERLNKVKNNTGEPNAKI